MKKMDFIISSFNNMEIKLKVSYVYVTSGIMSITYIGPSIFKQVEIVPAP